MHPLRPFQAQALQALIQPAHVICVAPTGSGKSRIYETLITKKGLRALLISPLIALARQQAEKLSRLGANVLLSSGQTESKTTSEVRRAPGAETEVWIISPESLLNPARQNEIRRWAPDLLVVDECHCLWEWGDQFRPAFSSLPHLLKKHPIERSLWLTATLPPEARADLRAQLPTPIIEIGEFGIPPQFEINALQTPGPEKLETLVAWVQNQRQSGIIFVPTRASTDRICNVLTALGRRALRYHAGLSSEERRATELLIAKQVPEVVVATSAFGMGMDHPHLSWVLLWQAPPSLLTLAQSVGRAGRNPRAPGRALVLWNNDDFRLFDWIVGNSDRRKADLVRVRHFLQSPSCRNLELKRYFDGEASGAPCGRCDRCRVAQMTRKADRVDSLPRAFAESRC